MTSNQKHNAREMGFQLQRDFHFHLQEKLDLTDLSNFIAAGNKTATDQEISRLTVMYAERIKKQAGSNYC